MSGREIRLMEILKYIKLGIDDSALKEKYKLSEQGLKSLHEKLLEAGFLKREGGQYFTPGQRRISTSEIVGDILSGHTNLELRKKYRISPHKLRKVFSKLLDIGVITAEEISHRTNQQKNEWGAEMRGCNRVTPMLSANIYEESEPENRGVVRDISDEGVGVRGMSAKVGQSKALVVVPEFLSEIVPFSFHANCCWFRSSDDSSLAGFEITFISGKDFIQMQKMIQLMTLLV